MAAQEFKLDLHDKDSNRYYHAWRHSAERIEAHAKTFMVLDLRQQGYSFPEIAAKMDMSQGYIYKLYKRGLAMMIQEPAEDVIKQELKRLDEMTKACWDILNASYLLFNRGVPAQAPVLDNDGRPILDDEGNPIYYFPNDPAPKLQAIDRLIRISERRAKLLGLDAPAKKEVSGPNGAPLQIEHSVTPDPELDWLGFPISREEKDVTAESVSLPQQAG